MPKRTTAAAEKNLNAPEEGAPTMTDQKSMVKATGSALMTSAPDWLKAELATMPDARKAGFENIDGADLVLPRLAIAHGTSPEVMDKSLGIEFGDVFDTVTKTVLIKATEKTPVIFLVASKSRIMFEKPQPPSPILGRSLDGKVATMDCGLTKKEEKTRNCADCIHSLFGDDNKKPSCTEFLSYLAIFPELNFQTYAISFKSTGLKKGRQILTQAKMTGAMMFAGKYELFAPKQTNGANTWWTFDAKPMGWVTKDEYERAKEMYQSFQGKTWAPSDLGSEVGDETTQQPAGDTDFPHGENAEPRVPATPDKSGF